MTEKVFTVHLERLACRFGRIRQEIARLKTMVPHPTIAKRPHRDGFERLGKRKKAYDLADRPQRTGGSHPSPIRRQLLTDTSRSDGSSPILQTSTRPYTRLQTASDRNNLATSFSSVAQMAVAANGEALAPRLATASPGCFFEK
ncbi:hypothetical protein R5H30_01270 [Sulfitobacter sp. D35]|uniref:hypothetical protein n=1 Tax=Sulfitobacter sp. D35 TaxID=3083252 RepID=UPI00296E384D|nr:hypothetical protein [Sulfitobacter sp. D35]MDW4496595.1 hypothetical protein [Sulfitobacter sp. D35]